MYAAVAAGGKNGGYDAIFEAAEKMAKVKKETFVPIPENVRIYDELYKHYSELHDYFGRKNTPIMHSLKKMRALREEVVLSLK
jgi:L-ribulokinase